MKKSDTPLPGLVSEHRPGDPFFSQLQKVQERAAAEYTNEKVRHATGKAHLGALSWGHLFLPIAEGTGARGRGIHY